MARFTNTSSPPKELKEIKIPRGGRRLIRVEGIKSRTADEIKLVVSSSIVTATIRDKPFNGSLGIWNIDLKGAAGKSGSVKVQAKYKNKIVATINVDVIIFTKITLPIAMTPEGLLSRLFLAESLNPEKPYFSAIESAKSMKWMRLVIENRLKHKQPNLFYAKKGSNKKWDLYDIVKARGQFHGFENYPSLPTSIKKNIKNILDIANDHAHSKQKRYAAFIHAALSAAKAKSPVKDPSKAGLYGWRTLKSRHPGGQFIKYKNLAGQTFYTLKK